jgi:hypothetical protein
VSLRLFFLFFYNNNDDDDDDDDDFFVKNPSFFNLVSFIIIKTKKEIIYLTLG